MEKRLKYSKLNSAIKHFKNEKPAPSGFILTFGNRGSGKSSGIAKEFYIWKKYKYKIYSNFYSNIELFDNLIESKCPYNSSYLDLTNHKLSDYFNPNDPVIAKNKLSTYNSLNGPSFFIERNSIICLDELGIIANNRDYKNFPIEITKFCKLLRKLGILFYANSQNFDIDKSLRLATSELRIQKKFINLSYSRKINKDIDINKSNDSNSADSQIVDKVEFAPIIEKGAIKFIYIPFYSMLYDSFS